MYGHRLLDAQGISLLSAIHNHWLVEAERIISPNFDDRPERVLIFWLYIILAYRLAVWWSHISQLLLISW